MRVLHLKHLDAPIEHEVMWSFSFGSKYFPPWFLTMYIRDSETKPNTLFLGTPHEDKPLGVLPTHLHDVCWAKSSYNSKQLCREAWDHVIGKGMKLKEKYSDVDPKLWPKHAVVDPSTNIPIRGPNKQLPWIVTVPLPFVQGIYGVSVRHPRLPSHSLILSLPLKLYHRKATMLLSPREHHTSDKTTCTHTPTHQNLHPAIHGWHACEDRLQTHNTLHIFSHAYADVPSYYPTVQNALVFLIPHSHSPDRPLPSTRQKQRRLPALLQVLLEPTLSLTRCIPTFTLSYIIPWCVPPTNTYPHPGHVSLGITSPLLLESSGPFPVDLASPPSSLDIALDPLCSHLKVPTMSLFVLLLHFDMMSQIIFPGSLSQVSSSLVWNLLLLLTTHSGAPELWGRPQLDPGPPPSHDPSSPLSLPTISTWS